ncbi:MAG: hypothetical protein ACJ762_06440 [Solirubrobacteraceae bacterium]
MLGGFAIAAVGAAGQESTSSNDPAPFSTTTAVTEVQPAIKEHFAIFRDQPASAMPADAAVAVGSPGRYGRNSDLAREIRTPSGPGYVIPANGYMCIAIPDPVDGYGESCASTEDAISRGLWVRLVGDQAESRAIDAFVIPDGEVLDATTSRSSQSAGRGAITRIGVASDPPPTLDDAN